MSPREPVSLAPVTLTQELYENDLPTLQEYIAAVSEYVRTPGLSAELKKRAQIVLSGGLARATARQMLARVPSMRLFTGERAVAGALRVVRADVSETNSVDGLRLAIELKPVNLAVGRAIWNRFGDIRTFAVNLHLKFPFAVVGGVLTVPLVEYRLPGKRALAAGRTEPWVSTNGVVMRAANRLIRAGGRRTEGDAPHLLEGVALVAYDPLTGQVSPDVPPVGSGIRWEEFIDAMCTTYLGRYEGAEEAVAAALDVQSAD